MTKLLIIRAKPNPAGKDRTRLLPAPPVQLAAEWVDFQNISSVKINLAGLQLYHYAYSGNTGQWELVSDFSGYLPAGEVIRIHSGNPIPLGQMHPEDRDGAHYHIFSEKNYIWNNSQKDFPRLWYKPTKEWIDQTEYNARPTEGKILQRINQFLQ